MMPQDFLNCVKAGGKVVTKKLGNGKYIHLCKTKSGKWTRGHTKTKQGSNKYSGSLK